MKDYPLNKEEFRGVIEQLAKLDGDTGEKIQLVRIIMHLPGFSTTIDSFRIPDLLKYNDVIVNTAFKLWYDDVYGDGAFQEDYEGSSVYGKLNFY